MISRGILKNRQNKIKINQDQSRFPSFLRPNSNRIQDERASETDEASREDEKSEARIERGRAKKHDTRTVRAPVAHVGKRSAALQPPRSERMLLLTRISAYVIL